MTIRNRPAHARGQAVRAAVRNLLASRSQLEPPLTAGEINELLQPEHRRCDSVIRWHRQAVQAEHIGRRRADSLGVPAAS